MATEDHTAGYGPGLATDYYKGFLERVLVAEEERRGPRDTAVGEQGGCLRYYAKAQTK